ncbi:MAG: hypothetical protein V7752_03685 [Halopseudomonas sp.]
MKNNVYSKGAEWRKWDLHVHTPSSVYQMYGKDDKETWERYICDLENLPEEFAVIGINDYLFIDGYEKLKTEQTNNGRLKNLKLLPVVEFRIDKFAGVDFGNHKRINLHVIFSDEISVETIRSQFLNTLDQSYVLNSGEKWTRAITYESVKDLGRSIKRSIPESERYKYGSDLVEGFNNLNLKEDQIFQSLQKDCFEGKHLIAIGKTEWAELKWTDSSIATKKSIINKSDIVFTSAESIESFIKSKNQLTNQGVNDLLLDCSDAHYFSTSEDKDRIGKCFTWLKADPTFDGLRQVINEPKERVFVGDRPPLLERVAKNRTKYIKSLSINQIDEYDDKNSIWFKNTTIPINSELVAIIGNKGSGKSAIADIISLCSNYYNNDDFSFLTDKKFREKKGKVAKNFEATLTWESNHEDKKNLNESPEKTEILEVKYLPQGRFERLTNEISSTVEFQNEIESVVFSHIPETEKLNTLSFKDLINKKTEAVNSELSAVINNIKEINKNIIDLENKATDSYQTEIRNKLNKKKEELDALEEPKLVPNPNEDPLKRQHHETANKTISDIRDKIQEFEYEIKRYESIKSDALKKIQDITNVKASIRQKIIDFNIFTNTLSEQLSGLNINIDKLISIETNEEELDKALEKEESLLEVAKKLLGESKQDIISSGTIPAKSLHEQLEIVQIKLKLEKGKLDSEQQVYQTYLTAMHNWNKDRETITGKEGDKNTIRFFEFELSYLKDKLPEILEINYKKRMKLVGNVFDKKQEIIAIYKNARNRLNEIISENSDTLKDYKIEIDASLVKSSDFYSSFLSHILQNKMGSFHSKEGAEKELNSLTSEIDFDNKDSVIGLLNKIMEALHADKRSGQNNITRVVSQQVKNAQELYDYIFSLSFLTNNYQLKQGDKEIDKLSPGERGALLLVFYLLLDKNEIPLIIDQPEDNLDNHSVATVLVPFIRAAKKKRQIIMVTHNPNLAVVSDAEQVIYVELDKVNNYSFSTLSGSIENKGVNQKIVEVLEGAMPAFNTRKNKYYEHQDS